MLRKPVNDSLGDYDVKVNPDGDPIFLSKNGLRKLRFDINDPHGYSPHGHLEIYNPFTRRWEEAIPNIHHFYF